jgi:hypothetical protein
MVMAARTMPHVWYQPIDSLVSRSAVPPGTVRSPYAFAPPKHFTE